MPPPRLTLPGSDILIRIARISPNDWGTLRSLRLRALEDSPTALLGNYQAEAAEGPEYWQTKCVIEIWFCAEINGRHVGLTKLSRTSDPAECMHIESMWVDPFYRNTGIARALVERLELEARKFGESELGLWVFDTNTTARQFYINMGYVGPLRRQKLQVGHWVAVEEEFRKRLSVSEPEAD